MKRYRSGTTSANSDIVQTTYVLKGLTTSIVTFAGGGRLEQDEHRVGRGGTARTRMWTA